MLRWPSRATFAHGACQRPLTKRLHLCVIVSVPKSRDPLKDQLHALVFEGVVENELQLYLRDPLEPAGFTQGGGFSRDQRKPWRKHEKAKKRDLEKGTRKLESPGIIRYSLRVLFGKVSG